MQKALRITRTTIYDVLEKILLGLEILVVLSHSHICLDDDGKYEVLNEEKQDDDVERQENRQLWSCPEVFWHVSEDD